MVQKEDITGISISLDADGDPRLFILLTADGAISRMGSGQLEDGKLDLCKGKTNEPFFAELIEALPDDLLENAGTYRVPDSKGTPMALTISMQAGSETATLEFYFGTESTGIPAEVMKFVQKSRELTEAWYRSQ